ncbi:MAG: 6-bladed beta-propeller [Terriglobia bacterium]|nr:6-bladed beta-propeller [Terriglobia bacterium]
MDLHSIEDVVENFEPPGHASRRLRAHTFFGNLRDDLVTLAYGREWVLRSPTMVTTDSRGRLIIADPQQHAVHVLEPKGRSSFRIAGGPQLRLRAPSSVAVDAEDNIYVADSQKGLVLVFDPQGYYVRSIGMIADESMFQYPEAIAVDRKLKRIYVLDAPMHELVILDLSGRLIRRIGGLRDKNSRFVNPLQIAVGENRFFVLENSGSRILVFSPDGDVLGGFPIPNQENSPQVHATAIALDAAGNIYLSNPVGSRVEILTSDGKPLGILGQAGINAGDFSSPAGLCIDSAGRLYVADTLNRRVQMFKLSSLESGS